MHPMIPTDPLLDPQDVRRESEFPLDTTATGRDRIFRTVWIVATLLVVALVFVVLIATAPDEPSTPTPSVDSNPSLEIPGQ